jgi:Flp pilus assembly protein TadG
MTDFGKWSLRALWNGSKTRRFRRCQDGAVTVEAVLWVPFFILFTFSIGELALVFYGQARTLEVVEDTNRALSVGQLASPDEAEAKIIERLAGVSTGVQAETQIFKGIITTVVKFPAKDLAGFGILTQMVGLDITVVAQQVLEF